MLGKKLNLSKLNTRFDHTVIDWYLQDAIDAMHGNLNLNKQ